MTGNLVGAQFLEVLHNIAQENNVVTEYDSKELQKTFLFFLSRVPSGGHEDFLSLVILELLDGIAVKRTVSKIDKEVVKRVLERVVKRISRSAKRRIPSIPDGAEPVATDKDQQRIETYDTIKATLDVLPRESTPIVCMHLQGHTVTEIAKTLSVSISTVSRRLSEVRNAVQHALHFKLRLGLGEYTEARTKKRSLRVEVTNKTEESLASVKVESVFVYDPPQDRSREFGASVLETGRRLSFSPTEEGELGEDKTRVFLYPPEAMKELCEVLRSRPPEHCFLSISVNGSHHSKIDGYKLVAFVEKRFPTPGQNDSRTLATGEEVHLVKPPGSSWSIKSYDRSWFEGQHLTPEGLSLGPKELKTVIVFAEQVGWSDLRFGTPDEAYEFVTDQLHGGEST